MDITERCEAILKKIYQNSEVTEQNLARHRLFQWPSPQWPSAAMAFGRNGLRPQFLRSNVLTDITERCEAILIKIYQNSECYRAKPCEASTFSMTAVVVISKIELSEAY